MALNPPLPNGKDINVRINTAPGRLLAYFSLVVAFMSGMSTMLPAQETQQPKQSSQPAPKLEVIAENGKWKVQCETPPAAEGQKPARQCGMVQSTQNEKNPKATLTLVIVKTVAADKTTYNMRVMAPIGVFLPTGVALEIDGAAVGRVPFTRCMPRVCMAFAEASADTLAKLKKGGEASFIIYEAPGMGLPMKLSLEGFSASLDALDKT